MIEPLLVVAWLLALLFGAALALSALLGLSIGLALLWLSVRPGRPA